MVAESASEEEEESAGSGDNSDDADDADKSDDSEAENDDDDGPDPDEFIQEVSFFVRSLFRNCPTIKTGSSGNYRHWGPHQ
jgi:hypothetical protein